MVYARISLLSFLLLSTVMTACGQVADPSQAVLQKQLSQSLHIEPLDSTSEKKSTSQLDTIATDSQALALKPVTQEIVRQQAEMRQQKTSHAESREELYSAEELAALQQLEADLSERIQQEDRQQAENQHFSIQSAQQGKDISIEMFMYNPKYSKRAKFWGIDNAYELLMAGRSPLRRWLLKRKLEGLLAPRGFDQLVLFWVEQADLLRISGVNRDQAWLLVANGITSVPDLARRNAVELGALRVSIALMAFQYGMDAPTLSELQTWAEEAKTLPPLIY